MLKIYGKKNCPYCDMAISLLKNKDIPYEYFSVEDDPENLKYLLDQNIKTVPAIWYGGEFIGGYTQLKEIL